MARFDDGPNLICHAGNKLFWRAGPTTSRVICPLPSCCLPPRPPGSFAQPPQHCPLRAELLPPPPPPPAAASSSSRLLVQSRGSSFSSSHAVWICSRQQHEAICRSAAAPGRSSSRVLDLQHEAPLRYACSLPLLAFLCIIACTLSLPCFLLLDS